MQGSKKKLDKAQKMVAMGLLSKSDFAALQREVEGSRGTKQEATEAKEGFSKEDFVQC